jgi:hypothetical protein
VPDCELSMKQFMLCTSEMWNLFATNLPAVCCDRGSGLCRWERCISCVQRFVLRFDREIFFAAALQSTVIWKEFILICRKLSFMKKSLFMAKELSCGSYICWDVELAVNGVSLRPIADL